MIAAAGALMKTRIFLLTIVLVSGAVSQTRQVYERPVRQAVRGVHGAVAAGSEYATEAGMKMYYRGGNAVDVGIATMFAASVTGLQHFGLGGEGPILIRTKDGKVHAIAGVGTMPKLASADMFRKRPLQAGEVEVRGKNGETGLKGIIPVAGLRRAQVLAASRDFFDLWPTSKAHFLPGGKAPQVGEIYRQPDTARTLRAMAGGEEKGVAHGASRGA